jgi:hypothetical protein
MFEAIADCAGNDRFAGHAPEFAFEPRFKSIDERITLCLTFSTGFRARPLPVALIALWNCGLMQMVPLDCSIRMIFCAVAAKIAVGGSGIARDSREATQPSAAYQQSAESLPLRNRGLGPLAMAVLLFPLAGRTAAPGRARASIGRAQSFAARGLAQMAAPQGKGEGAMLRSGAEMLNSESVAGMRLGSRRPILVQADSTHGEIGAIQMPGLTW